MFVSYSIKISPNYVDIRYYINTVLYYEKNNLKHCNLNISINHGPCYY